MVKNMFLVCVLAVFKSLVHGAYDGDRLSVMEGDSVTLRTGITINPQDGIMWYFNGIRIAQISGDLSYICTDVQCDEGNERFRDRLELDYQTGSLTIMNIRNTDSGVYHQSMIFNSDKYFNVHVHGVPAAEREVMERESVILGSGLSAGDVTGMSVAVLLLTAAAACTGVMYCRRRSSKKGTI